MAKPATVKIRLVSSEGTGFFYVTKKNPRNITEKMSFRKYDPVVKKHVEFKEAKIFVRLNGPLHLIHRQFNPPGVAARL